MKQAKSRGPNVKALNVRIRTAKFEKFQSYPQWIQAIKSRGADKTLAEAPNSSYKALVYGAVKGNLNIVGHWDPQNKEGHAYSTPFFFRPFNRTFKAVWINKMSAAQNKKSDTIRVSGSKGNIYEVARDGSNCTCPGFTFRRKCKHVDKIKKR